VYPYRAAAEWAGVGPTATSPTSWESKARATVKFQRKQNPLNQERVNETSCLDTDGDFNRWPAGRVMRLGRLMIDAPAT
jgi:hypothetical protein